MRCLLTERKSFAFRLKVRNRNHYTFGDKGAFARLSPVAHSKEG